VLGRVVDALGNPIDGQVSVSLYTCHRLMSPVLCVCLVIRWILCLSSSYCACLIRCARALSCEAFVFDAACLVCRVP
jgi:hypothetical protein